MMLNVKGKLMNVSVFLSHNMLCFINVTFGY